MSAWVWLNGEIVEDDRAALSIYDAGMLHGAGLFETMRAYNGVIFRLEDHLARMRASAEALNLIEFGDEAEDRLSSDLAALLDKNGLRDARVRLTLTPGDLRQRADAESPPRPTMFATAVPIEPHPPRLYEKGMTVLISVHKQSRLDPTCGYKTLSYLPRLISLREAQARGCGEALWFTHENLLAEGAISNVFLVDHGVIKTPPIDTPILPGVTRRVVIELARSNDFSVQETPLTINDLLDANEVFLTNSVMEVMPVCHVERRAIGDQKPGPVTRQIGALYQQAVQEECNLDAG